MFAATVVTSAPTSGRHRPTDLLADRQEGRQALHRLRLLTHTTCTLSSAFCQQASRQAGSLLGGQKSCHWVDGRMDG